MQLGVVGDPVDHSLSPALHSAAYRVLGLPWHYERARVAAGDLGAHVAELGPRWRGLTVTAPLKREAHALCRWVDDAARATGAVNTVLLASRRGWNTDVPGIMAAFARSGVQEVEVAGIVGGGATAMSAVLALHRMGALRLELRVRSQERAAPVAELAEQIGMEVTIADLAQPLSPSAVVVSTLPGTASVVPPLGEPLAVLDADYAGGVSRYAQGHRDRVIPGTEMLLGQALVQIRVFVGGDADRALPNEAAVMQAMRHAIGMGD